MDRIIGEYPSVAFGELSFCYTKNLLYQTDMSQSVEYGKDYFDHYVKLTNTDIANELNAQRVALTEKYQCKSVLDIGIGSGEFIENLRCLGYGYDINPYGINWLKSRNIYIDPYASIPKHIDAVTLWDTLEHIPLPSSFLEMVQDQYVFISLPIFNDLMKIRQSKHYKKNEHYYYYSTSGLINVLNDNGFKLLEISDMETVAGRESILSFVFRRSNGTN